MLILLAIKNDVKSKESIKYVFDTQWCVLKSLTHYPSIFKLVNNLFGYMNA